MISRPSMGGETITESHRPLGRVEKRHRHRALFLALGVWLMALGTLGTLAAGLFTLASILVFGSILIIAGIAVAIHAFWAKEWNGFFLQLLSGLFYLVAGWILAARPGLSAITLTLIIAISLVVQGAFRIGAALSTPVDSRGSLLMSGIVTLGLGLMIWNEWPFSGLWVIGIFTGLDMIFYGGWLVSLGLAVRRPRLRLVRGTTAPAARTSLINRR
jgi:uncharacterized membrane protein HdeD (DUF308 family)